MMNTSNPRLAYRFWLLAGLICIAVLAFAPLQSDPGTGNDKINHILAFLFLAWLANRAFPGLKVRIWLGLLAFGLFIEVTQKFLPYRSFSWWDLMADGVGILLHDIAFQLAVSSRAGKTRP